MGFDSAAGAKAYTEGEAFLKMAKRNTGATIAISCLVVFVGLMLYNIAEISAFNPIIMFGSIFLILGLIFQRVWGDWFASLFPAKPEFVSYSGLGGRLMIGPISLPGGQQKCLVSFNSSSLPKLLKDGTSNWFWAFIGMITGTTIKEVIGRREQFHFVEKKDCENPNGCMFFKGRIDGAELRDPEIMSGLTELKRLSDAYRATVSTMKQYGHQLATIVNQRNLDDDHAYSRAKMIADNMKNIKIITKGSGGSADAVASEMQ